MEKKKKAERHPGNVYRRKDSPYWWGQVIVGGERHQRAFFRNKVASLEEFRKWRIIMKDGKGSKDWDWYKKDFLENISADRRPTTVLRYKMTFATVDRIIKPKTLADFTVENLEKWRNQLKKESGEKGCNHSGINKYIICLKTVLKTAMEKDYAKNLKIFVLKRFTVTVKPLQAYPIWKLVLIRKYARPTYKVYCFLCCRAGMRPEEPRNLLKIRLDWEDKSGMIQNNDVNLKKGIASWVPKKNFIRPFSFEDPYLVEALKELPPTKSEYLLTNKYGEPYNEQGAYASWAKELKRINNCIEEDYKDKKKRAELKTLLGKHFTEKPIKVTGNLKNLRKTFATQLRDREEVKESDIGILLGHRPKGVTDTHYFVKEFKKSRHIIKYLPELKVT